MNYKINNNHTNDRNDWRFQGQDEYLMNEELVFEDFNSSIRDHDHCEFCRTKFSENKDDLHKGYCTKNKYHWICEQCFNDFNYIFNWKIVNHKENSE